jgi:16S rRNA (uracil1498-N3)-methyltransferase
MPVEKIETLNPILKFSNVNMLQNTLNIMPWECEDGRSISKILSGIDEKITYINIFIGPEGGFEQKEINAALKCDFKTVTLGKNILRVETAAIVASSLAVSYVEN